MAFNVWRKSRAISKQLWTDNERAWLDYDGSLTQRLRDVTRGHIEHRIYQEAFACPEHEESLLLQLHPATNARIREIDWWGNGKLWVTGRVVLPESTLNRMPVLQTIGRRALGDILFAHTGMQRDSLEFAQINTQHFGFRRVRQHLSPHIHFIWSRRSLFYLDGNPLLVNETFLPNIFQINVI